MEDHLDLHAVDMQGPHDDITAQLMHQMTNLGFLALANIPGYDEEALFRHQKWFFALSPEAKQALYKNHFRKENKNLYRGLAPFIDNDPSHKELYEIGLDWAQVSEEERRYPLHEETPWPAVEGGEEFKAFMTKHYDVMHKLGMKVMSHIAEGLGQPAGYFDKWFARDTCSTFRIIHYLPRSADLVQQDKLSSEQLRFTTPIHTDSGFLTLLSTFSYPGLQVDVGEGVYKSVRPVPNTLVVNLGDMLSRITNYKLKATKHRVLDIGVERFSSPFFFEPHYAARIPTEVGKAKDDDVFVYGDWVIEKMREFGEFKDLFKNKTY